MKLNIPCMTPGRLTRSKEPGLRGTGLWDALGLGFRVEGAVWVDLGGSAAAPSTDAQARHSRFLGSMGQATKNRRP